MDEIVGFRRGLWLVLLYRGDLSVDAFLLLSEFEFEDFPLLITCVFEGFDFVEVALVGV